MRIGSFHKFAVIFRRLHAPVSNRRGVILIGVIWICALLMWFAFQISAETRLQGEDQIHTIRKSQAVHLAIGGCYEALARMGQPAPINADEASDLNWQPDGRPRMVQYQTGIAIVIIESEDLKVNVNKVQQSQLLQVIERMGADEVTGEQIADRILDFIDPDDTPRLHGMEKDGYKKQGLSYIPFNGPLTSLDQLLLVPGITQQIFYGYGQEKDGKRTEFPEGFQDLAIPGKNSLFNLLTIYGKNTKLPSAIDEEQQTYLRSISWKPGGTYRILSFGKTVYGPPTAGIWLTARFTNDGRNPFKILSRKVM